MNPVKIATYVVGGLFAILVLIGSYYTVDQGERAVVLRMGAMIGDSGP